MHTTNKIIWLVALVFVLLIIVIAVLKIEAIKNAQVPEVGLTLKQNYQMQVEKILNKFLTDKISAEQALNLIMDLRITSDLKELHLKLVLALNASDVKQVKSLLNEIDKL